ncbi:hypothetical protein E3T26_00915 [Cryobacterium sp. TMT1-21]|uniref:Cupin domain-containing protein n=1 Tax=Cryobacterium shii TaxID=1259235 RepID=A0AAQ2HF30_9MICO|nr:MULTISPECIES: hypothetical protein [Cryobacterium]TFC44338.1 hypothetical protein E3O49_11850 [Cryobacterium shii]TFC88408.1 hypothetical protein E3T24_02730 [Cryobacterium sp. TmT2-59]TFD17888.1 hypothetical protein E3T26_00915 [Cryobacterium sp. TMT1-21]TFD18012.1 hypothetical protein E3T32_13060 [Cryobacterium sp. TMT2-23]TFD35811.1 hypothetical protein E3T37_14970 [Cryobacterium sp. TMT2-10]
MPKVSKDTASSHTGFPGYVDAYEQEIGGWTVTIESNLIDMDQAIFFKGALNDQCQANHFGYVLKGKFGVRTGEGVEEFFEAGDAFIIEPGHTPIVFAGCEYVAFTPTQDAKEQAAVIMPNVMKFAQEQGIALPAQGPSS